MVASGSGGMMQVQDRRFQPRGDWPVRFEVAPEFADTWLRYFYAECARRGWSRGGMGQLEAKENSGSITVNTGTGSQLALVWERRRGGPPAPLPNAETAHRRRLRPAVRSAEPGADRGS